MREGVPPGTGASHADFNTIAQQSVHHHFQLYANLYVIDQSRPSGPILGTAIVPIESAAFRAPATAFNRSPVPATAGNRDSLKTRRGPG